MQFTLGMYGEGDFYTLKGVVEEFFRKVGMQKKPLYEPDADRPYLHPGRQADIFYQGAAIGYIGEVHPTVAGHYGIKDRVYVAVLDMQEVVAHAGFDRKYQGIARFPASTRDISMVAPKTALAGEIERVFEEKGGPYLESYALFDIYEGKQIQSGFRSLAYSLVFRGKEKNLEEADLTKAMERILKALEEMGIELRKSS